MADQVINPGDLAPWFFAADYAKDRKHHVLVSATGSIAAVQLPNIVRALGKREMISLRIILTASARNFFQGQTPEQPTLQELRTYPNVDGVYLDEDEWRYPWTPGMPILNTELRRWAHCLVIAPLTAHTMSKITLGLGDNLLTSVVRAWDFFRSPENRKIATYPRPRIFIAPSMNRLMWENPITVRQVLSLQHDLGYKGENSQGWFRLLKPIGKELEEGDRGEDAMLEWDKIVASVENYLGQINF